MLLFETYGGWTGASRWWRAALPTDAGQGAEQANETAVRERSELVDVSTWLALSRCRRPCTVNHKAPVDSSFIQLKYPVYSKRPTRYSFGCAWGSKDRCCMISSADRRSLAINASRSR